MAGLCSGSPVWPASAAATAPSKNTFRQDVPSLLVSETAWRSFIGTAYAMMVRGPKEHEEARSECTAIKGQRKIQRVQGDFRNDKGRSDSPADSCL